MVALTQQAWDFTGMQLPMERVSALAKELAASTSVQILLLARTGLDDAGAKVLAQGIAENRSLRKLFLNANEVGSAGVRSICESLAKHPTVECVNFAKNPIKDEGAAALAKLVVQHRGIKQLILDDCHLDAAAFAELEPVLTSHGACGLVMLSVWHNTMPADLRRRWADLIQGHESLVSIDLPEPIVNMTVAAPCTAQDRG